MNDAQPIGIFDSGVGGLTVLHAIRRRLPGEATIYIADLAHFPYGPKPAHLVRSYAGDIAAYLLGRNVKGIVVACNTATAAALPSLQAMSSIPVIGVVAPGAEAALQRSRNGRIGVLATEGTVRSGAYARALGEPSRHVTVYQLAAGVLVEAVEHGLAGTVEIERLAWPFVSELLAHGCDTIILGCTHFPLIRDVFERLAGPTVAIVDSATTTAAALVRVVGNPPPGSPPARHELYVTAATSAFARRARTLFAETIQAQHLDIPAGAWRWYPHDERAVQAE